MSGITPHADAAARTVLDRHVQAGHIDRKEADDAYTSNVAQVKATLAAMYRESGNPLHISRVLSDELVEAQAGHWAARGEPQEATAVRRLVAAELCEAVWNGLWQDFAGQDAMRAGAGWADMESEALRDVERLTSDPALYAPAAAVAQPCTGQSCAGSGCAHEQAAAARLIAHEKAGLYAVGECEASGMEGPR
jgi:hypothetical protein